MSDEDRRKLLALRDVLNGLIHESLGSGVKSGGSPAEERTSAWRVEGQEGDRRTRQRRGSSASAAAPSRSQVVAVDRPKAEHRVRRPECQSREGARR